MPAGRKIQRTSTSWKLFDGEREEADMAGKLSVSLDGTPSSDWSADEQNLLAATLSATPAQRLAWLEEALHLAYVSGALKPRSPITKGEWDAASLRVLLIARPIRQKAQDGGR